jgi:integrase
MWRTAWDITSVNSGAKHPRNWPPSGFLPYAHPADLLIALAIGLLAALLVAVEWSTLRTPHGLRHTYKTLMVELGTPATLMDAQMGHEDGSVQARYSHITPDMVQRLLDGLTAGW